MKLSADILAKQDLGRRRAALRALELREAADREAKCGFAFSDMSEYHSAVCRASASFRWLLQGDQSAVRLTDSDQGRCIELLREISRIVFSAACDKNMVPTDLANRIKAARSAPPTRKVNAAKRDAALQTLLRKSMAAALEGEQ